jgi:hypothetical protein
VQRDLFPALRGVGSVQFASVAHRDRASYTGDNWRMLWPVYIDNPLFVFDHPVS